MLAVEILVERVEDVSLHGPLLVLIEGVPADAHDHAVHWPTVNRGQAPVDPSHQLAGQLLYHLLREIGGGEA